MSDGMRAADFTKCRICGKGVAHTNVPLFYRVKIERMGMDRRAIERIDAMERYMGGSVALARVFEDPVIATAIYEKTVLLCEKCGTEPHPLAALTESE